MVSEEDVLSTQKERKGLQRNANVQQTFSKRSAQRSANVQHNAKASAQRKACEEVDRGDWMLEPFVM